MCTALSRPGPGPLFGRTLDVEFTFKEQVVITPRKRRFRLKNGRDYETRYALMGMASVMGDVPLYYEACNERGVAMAGLNFPRSAVYQEPVGDERDIAPSELIPWVLGQAESLDQARVLLETLNLTNVPFSPRLPNSPLHYILGDKTGTLVVEPMEEGLKLYDAPCGVMTNEPPYDYQLWNLHRYRLLSPQNGPDTFGGDYDLPDYGVGLGAVGLPGDASGPSRFVRAAYHLANSHWGDSREEQVGQFFHVLDSVAMVKGAVQTKEGKDDLTLYSCCMDLEQGVYYYTTYGNHRIHAVRLHSTDLDGEELVCFDLRREQDILYEN